MKIIGLCSLLGESNAANSITRSFRDEPVLRHTLRRVASVAGLAEIVVTHWDDQRADCVLLDGVDLFSAGRRDPSPAMVATSAAQKWADGWRGGLLGTAACDRGFDAAIVLRVLAERDADAALLFDPAAALIDRAALEELVQRGREGPRTFYFNHAPPGLGGVMVKRSFVELLARQNIAPGRSLHYLPDAPTLDPVLSDACVPTPLSVSRASGSFLLNSRRSLTQFDRATHYLNGKLAISDAETIVRCAQGVNSTAMPRDLTIELTTRRVSRPIYSPLAAGPIDRPDSDHAVVAAVAAEAATCDDLRITLGGVGDPLCHPHFASIVQALSGVHTLHVETDLLEMDDATAAALVSGAVDVITVHLPAMRPTTYAAAMGVDAMQTVLANIEKLLRARHAAGQSTPLIVPLLLKMPLNFDELETWYDTWLRALGSAVVIGPSTHCGRIADTGVADVAPPLRGPCRRIATRMTLRSNGRFATCEEETDGEIAPLGTAGSQSIAQAWAAMRDLWQSHLTGDTIPDACRNCKEWHRA